MLRQPDNSLCECRGETRDMPCEEDCSYAPFGEDERCPTCKGHGTINPLTAPEGFFCAGLTDCPTCDGIGRF